MDNMTIFDFIEGGHRFAPVIDELSADLSRVFSNKDYEEQYKIWDHVPYLGYRYSALVSVSKHEYANTIRELEQIKKKYAKEKLEISIIQTPCFKTEGNAKLFISTEWKDKQRARNG